MDAMRFLDEACPDTPQPLVVVFGDEDFLKRQAVAKLQARVLGTGERAELGLSVLNGESLDFSTVANELATLPFLSSRRLVVVEQADSFVSRAREQLEAYLAKPSQTGVLVLDVKSWTRTTRLAKALPDEATIECKAPLSDKLVAWIGKWSQSRHRKKIEPAAANLLAELIGPHLGQLDQELAKLSVTVAESAPIKQADVDTLVGRSRAAETFKIFDAIGRGQPAEALAILHQLVEQGVEPLQILGAFSWQLRRLALIGRLVLNGQSLAEAMDAAGVPPFPAARRSTEQLLRHLGTRRLTQVLDWLVEVDLGLKGSSELPPTTQLERLLVRLARPR
jgi:DNA polymerase-3 subunit delta